MTGSPDVLVLFVVRFVIAVVVGFLVVFGVCTVVAVVVVGFLVFFVVWTVVGVASLLVTFFVTLVVGFGLFLLPTESLPVI